MATKTIYCDTSELEKDIKDLRETLSGQSIHAAISNALNRTLTFVGAETKRQVRSEYTVKATPIARALTKKRATRANLQAEAVYKDNPLPLYVFKHKIPSNQYRSPVMITIKQGGGKRVDYTNGNGGRQVLFGAYGNKKIMRRDLTQKKLKTAYSVSVPQMVASKDVYDVIVKKAEETLQKRLEHEIQWRLSKL